MRHYCPGKLSSFSSEDKKVLVSSTGILKNALHKSITVKNLLQLGWMLAVHEDQEQGVRITMFCPPLSLWFSHRYKSVIGTIGRNNRALTYVISYYGLYTLQDLFTYGIFWEEVLKDQLKSLQVHCGLCQYQLKILPVKKMTELTYALRFSKYHQK